MSLESQKVIKSNQFYLIRNGARVNWVRNIVKKKQKKKEEM